MKNGIKMIESEYKHWPIDSTGVLGRFNYDNVTAVTSMLLRSCLKVTVFIVKRIHHIYRLNFSECYGAV